MGEEAEVDDRDGVEVEVVVHGCEGHGIERERDESDLGGGGKSKLYGRSKQGVSYLGCN